MKLEQEDDAQSIEPLKPLLTRAGLLVGPPGAAIALPAMPVDHMELLAWVAQRENAFPGCGLDGGAVMQQASGLAGSDGLPWDAVARAAAQLRRLGLIAWDYSSWPAETMEPSPEFIGQSLFQRTRDIIVTGHGHQALAARIAKESAVQVNSVNSTVGQLAFGDIRNVDVFVILDAAERALAEVEGADQAKTEARRILQRMKAAASSTVSSAAHEVLAAP